MATSPLTTHILDTSTGLPAEGVEVSLFRITDKEILTARTRSDKDGRCPRLLSHGQPILGQIKTYDIKSGLLMSPLGSCTVSDVYVGLSATMCCFSMHRYL
mmetsp:Transcript_17395/g.70549  ORF Transcript_17395/g.70549 Transcript_17395/m.70549 type:complete len:101 (+) Transcript_17395:2026-2328(+)